MTIGRPILVAVALVVAVGGLVLWWQRPFRTEQSVEPPAEPSVPAAESSGRFVAQPIGERPRGDERPFIANVAVVDLDRDGLADVLVCDALRNQVTWIRQSPRGTYTESLVGAVAAPSHVQPVDFDGDGDLDLVVGSLGALFPNNNPIGSVIIFENDGAQRFSPHVIAEQIARVADARAGDLDGDGDLDLAVAGFGYDDGETRWLRNMGGWTFEPHVLQRLSGVINALIVDVNGDRALDIVTLVSQEWEEIWAFVNQGGGRFQPRMLWGSTNPDFGSSWLSTADMDGDGDVDLLYSNGDAFEYQPANSRPWQGVQWLENQGDLAFELHRVLDLQGATSAEAVDVDGDGDLDVALVVSNNDWDNPRAASLMWLENGAAGRFVRHDAATSPTHLQTLAFGDLDGDGDSDLVTGGMHISRPYDRIGRITAWINAGERAGR